MEAIAPDVLIVGKAPPEVLANPIDTALQLIGFENAATRKRIQAEGLGTLEDLASMKEKDIRDLTESYGRRTVGDGRFIF
jgi:hypothetical protein